MEHEEIPGAETYDGGLVTEHHPDDDARGIVVFAGALLKLLGSLI